MLAKPSIIKVNKSKDESDRNSGGSLLLVFHLLRC